MSEDDTWFRDVRFTEPTHRITTGAYGPAPAPPWLGVPVASHLNHDGSRNRIVRMQVVIPLESGWEVGDMVDVGANTLTPITWHPIIPAYYGPPLPSCPDGSGDLWWDDASYIRYQSYDPPYEPEHIAEHGYSEGYCDGRPMIYALDIAIGHSCLCHTPDDDQWWPF